MWSPCSSGSGAIRRARQLRMVNHLPSNKVLRDCKCLGVGQSEGSIWPPRCCEGKGTSEQEGATWLSAAGTCSYFMLAGASPQQILNPALSHLQSSSVSPYQV